MSNTTKVIPSKNKSSAIISPDTSINKKSIDSYDKYQHENGLVQLKVKNKGGFSAVFVVNTPALDDSGVSHAVEHFIFRRSQLFPQVDTLFQLVALTDLKINASTLSNKTYYHCQSYCLESFLLGLKYLLSGILTPQFVAEDLAKEITNHDNGGVIYQELSSIHVNKEAIKQRQVNLSDNTAERCHQYAGTCQSISSISLDDLIQYHHKYYQAKKMTLITANVTTEQLCKLIRLIIANEKTVKSKSKVVKGYNKKPLLANHTLDTDKILIRYWLLDDFFNYLEHSYNDLVKLLTPLNIEIRPLQRNLNKDNKFPLDIVSNKLSKCHHEIDTLVHGHIKNNYQDYIATQVKLGEDNCAKGNHQKKYSPEINDLISVYDSYQNKASQTHKTINEMLSTLGKARVHKLAALNSCAELTLATDSSLMREKTVRNKAHDCNQKKITDYLPKSDECRLINELEQLALNLEAQTHITNDKARLVKIPGVILPLYQIALKAMSRTSPDPMSTVCDNNHSLIAVENKGNEEALFIMLSYIISAYPKILSARCQGQCYLITAQYHAKDKCLVIFSAFDNEPALRVKVIGDDLLSLSQDKRFIEATISLAKTKYQQMCQGSIEQANKVTVSIILAYLNEISRKILTHNI